MVRGLSFEWGLQCSDPRRLPILFDEAVLMMITRVRITVCS
jgi:hypothetical protein